MSNFRYWRQGNQRYERLIKYKLSNCDFMMSLIQRVILPLQALVHASSEERKDLLETKPPKQMACWPDGVLDDFKRIGDWDEVFRTAHDLWQAQNCVSLFATDIPRRPVQCSHHAHFNGMRIRHGPIDQSQWLCSRTRNGQSSSAWIDWLSIPSI
jgi:hypothetical protein